MASVLRQLIELILPPCRELRGKLEFPRRQRPQWIYVYSSQDWVRNKSSINVYCLQLSQTLILPLASHLPPHPYQEEQPGHIPPQHSTSRPPWRWSRRNRWAEPIREDRKDSSPSSPGFDNPIRPHPASRCPAVPRIQLVPPQQAFHTPLLQTPRCYLLWGALPRVQQCGSLSFREGTALPHLQPALITVLQALFTYLLPPPIEDFREGTVVCSPLFLTPSSRPGHTGSQVNLY